MTAVLALAVIVALCLVAIATNHATARVGLVEVVLNEGLPPGHEVVTPGHPGHADPAELDGLLGPGIHVFLSRSCHACMRLIDEFATAPLAPSSGTPPLHLRYIDRPRPIAHEAARASSAELHTDQGEIAAQIGADPLPYTLVVGAGGSLARGVSPSRKDVITLALDAGYSIAAARAEPSAP